MSPIGRRAPPSGQISAGQILEAHGEGGEGGGEGGAGGQGGAGGGEGGVGGAGPGLNGLGGGAGGGLGGAGGGGGTHAHLVIASLHGSSSKGHMEDRRATWGSLSAPRFFC